MEKKARFIGLEWLRFLLGCYVMIYHTLHAYPQVRQVPWLSELTSMGFFATSNFFVLSGFLLTHVYFNNTKMREPAKTFWIKRFCNLYPIHIVALLASIVILLLVNGLPIPPYVDDATPRFVVYDTHETLDATAAAALRHYMTNGELLLNAVLQLLMLQAWNPLYLTFNAPLWSLSTLFFFYLLFPFVAPRLLAVRHIKLALTIVCVVYLIPPEFVVWQKLWGIPWTGLLQRGPLFRLPEFLAGILGYALFRQHQREGFVLQGPGRFALIVFIALCFLVATWLFTHSGKKHWYFLLHNGLLLPAQVALVYVCALISSPKTAWLQHWLPRLGATSLSIFALHVPLFWFWRTLEPLVISLFLPCTSGWLECANMMADTTMTLPGYLLFLLFTVWICLQFQEKFVVRVRKALLRKWLPAA